MSHISQIKLSITNLKALKKACNRLGATFSENKGTYKYYYGNKECLHTISHPKAQYEIGVVKTGKEFELQWDSFYSGGLPKVFGYNAGLLKQAYAIEQAKIAAMLEGYTVTEKKIGDEIKLTINME